MGFGNDDGWLKQHLPNVRIYANPRKRKIAIPREPGYNRQGFWDIKAKQNVLIFFFFHFTDYSMQQLNLNYVTQWLFYVVMV